MHYLGHSRRLDVLRTNDTACSFFPFESAEGAAKNSYRGRKFLAAAVSALQKAGLTVEEQRFRVDMGSFAFYYVRHSVDVGRRACGLALCEVTETLALHRSPQEDAISLLVAEARPALFEWLLLVLAILYSLLVYVLLKTRGSPAAMVELGEGPV